MPTSEIIAFIFKLINFGALVGGFTYLFQRKLKEPLVTKIKEKKLFWKNLEINKQALIDRQHKLDLEISWQDEYGKTLLKKIAQWDNASAQEEAALVKKMEKNAQDVYEGSVRAQKSQKMQKALDALVPIVFGQARTTLKKKYLPQDSGQEYIAKILGSMHKGLS